MSEAPRFTERLRLEPIDECHAGQLLALYRDPAVAPWYGEWASEQIVAEVARMAEGWRVDGAHKWMAYDQVSGEVVGRGGLSWQEVDGAWRWEVGWVLHGRFWGRGYAAEIGRAGVKLAFDELGADEVVAFTEPHNQRSRAVMHRLNFEYTKEFTRNDLHFALYRLRRPASGH